MAMKKQDALAVVFAAAQEYQEQLVNRSLLFVCMNKHKKVYCLEVTFDSSNFKHLTGFQTELSALQFFDKCIRKRLREDDFEFAKDGTTPLKMQVLPYIVSKNLSANMIGDYNQAQPRLYTEKMAGSISACVGFVKNKGVGRYVPNTVLEGDIRSHVNRPDRVILTYRKKRDEKSYTELVYKAKKINWSELHLPEEYKKLPLPEEK